MFIKVSILVFLMGLAKFAAAQNLIITDPKSGLMLSVINNDYPLLKILIPGQPRSDRGIEIEFPEHVTAFNKKTNSIEHLYLATCHHTDPSTDVKPGKTKSLSLKTLVVKQNLRNVLTLISR